ncbi:MAG TPA: GGDEF domain-containing protein [Solirubrobacteraceae bacterium]|nr:GGDEF domain-containing protein [Solirubrobacteraceae bacterium]
MPADRRIIAHSAAGIYAGAVLVSAVEEAIPGGNAASVGPGIAAVVAIPLLVFLGPRLSRRQIVAAGPLGAALIAWAMATTHGYGDGAVLYMWPVVWMAAFFGRRGAAAIVAWVALVHGVALLAMPAAQANVDRWFDVVAAVTVVAAVIRVLVERNQRLVTQLAAEARTDPLTGLLNRRGMRERMDVELARAARDHSPIAMISFDIDYFKLVNDRHGHEVGDRVLALVGALLASEARGADIAARTGGEEFAVALPGAGEAEALTFADRARSALADSSSAVRQAYGIPITLTLTMSAGIACAIGDIDDHVLMAEADRALYAAKHAGRDQAAVASGVESAV